MHKTLTFDIHRFALHDGPGIRTCVFLKGCPLHCKWCHNPESWSVDAELSYDEKKCSNCMLCVDICPNAAHKNKNGKHKLDRALCNVCGKCAEKCITKALKIYGKNQSVKEIINEVKKDKEYYKESGGGITISGGEPMMHPDFTMELLIAAKEEGIDTCLDTSGCVSWELYEKVLPFVDVWHYDYKANSKLSKKLTGVNEKKSKEILYKIYKEAPNAQIFLRCPMIPNINDDDEHLTNIAKICLELPKIKLNILPWHNMGGNKRKQLGKKTRNYPIENAKKEYEEMIEQKIQSLISSLQTYDKNII